MYKPLVTARKTYATYARALKALENVGFDLATVRFVMGATETGRFYPILVGKEYVTLCSVFAVVAG